MYLFTYPGSVRIALKLWPSPPLPSVSKNICYLKYQLGMVRCLESLDIQSIHVATRRCSLSRVKWYEIYWLAAQRYQFYLSIIQPAISMHRRLQWKNVKGFNVKVKLNNQINSNEFFKLDRDFRCHLLLSICLVLPK